MIFVFIDEFTGSSQVLNWKRYLLNSILEDKKKVTVKMVVDSKVYPEFRITYFLLYHTNEQFPAA